MEAAGEGWFLRLVRVPNNSYCELGHWSRSYGTSTWMVAPWMAPVDPVTELEILQELHGVLLDLMERRATA